jgi:AP endonuclease-1
MFRWPTAKTRSSISIYIFAENPENPLRLWRPAARGAAFDATGCCVLEPQEEIMTKGAVAKRGRAAESDSDAEAASQQSSQAASQDSDDDAPAGKKTKVETASGATKGKKQKLGGKVAKAAKVAAKVATKAAAGPAATEESLLAGTVPFSRETKDKDFSAKTMLKLVTWNVAGLRAKGRAESLQAFAAEQAPDVICLQETKLSQPSDGAKLAVLEGYTFTDNISTAKKGYSGTRTYVRDGLKVTAQTVGIAGDGSDPEGRTQTTTVAGVAVVNSYVPNSGMKLDRLEYRVGEFDAAMRAYLQTVDGPLVWTGDLNVAERDYDRFFAGGLKQMEKVCGFTPQERASFRTTLKEAKLVDAFRHKYPTANKAYTFWSMRFGQRAKNNGWRLDYFVVSAALASRVVDCFPLKQYDVSDHSPVVLWLTK